MPLLADSPQVFHRACSQLNAQDQVATLCGRVVNYQRANRSFTNVDCPACVGAADTIINDFVRTCQKIVDPLIPKG